MEGRPLVGALVEVGRVVGTVVGMVVGRPFLALVGALEGVAPVRQ